MDVSTACDDMMMHSLVPSIVFDVEMCEPHVSSPSIPKRVRRRLLETSENKSRSPSSLQEIETKLKEAELRRQQFHGWLANKAKPKRKRDMHMLRPESLGQRIRTKLFAAEQKRLDRLTQEQTRLARSQELRAAAKLEVQLRAEREREELESRVESRVQQAESNRLALLEAEKQKRAVAHGRLTRSIVYRTSQEGKDMERIEALRALICQRIAAAEEKRESRLKAQRTRAQASVLQARRVAKAVSRKRELESRKRKELLEARLQRAKKRRADYLGHRGGRKNGHHKMRKHGEWLCRKLARCWRRFQNSRQTTLKLAQDFVTCSIDQQAVVSLPFEKVVARITSPTSLRSVRAFLARLESRFVLSAASRSNIAQIDHLLKKLFPGNKKSGRSTKRASCKLQSDKDEIGSTLATSQEEKLDRYPVRVFLCAYMILGHPEAVFSVHGQREDALSKAALKLVLEFEALVSTIVNGPGSSVDTRPSTPSYTPPVTTNAGTGTKSFALQLAEFDSAWGSYLYQFVAWKVEDAHLLEEDLIKVACQLELSMLQKCCVSSGGMEAEASLDSQAIQQQVLEDHQLLRERVMHLTGSTGVEKLQQAVLQTRTKFSADQEECHLANSSLCSPQPNPQTSNPSSELTVSDEGTHTQFCPLLSRLHENTEMRVDPMVLNVRPCQLNPDLITMDNERMVNEMLHEPNWSSSDPFFGMNSTPGKFAEIQAQVKVAMNVTFWNLVMDGLSKDPPDYKRVTGLLEEIRTELEGLAPPSWRPEINECLDVKIFSQVLESGSQDQAYFQRLLDYAFGIVLKLSAPARDGDSKRSFELLLNELSQTWAQEQGGESHNTFAVSLVKGLRFVLEQIQVLKADISAARIQALAPIIQGSAGIDYLKRSFAKNFAIPNIQATQKGDDISTKLPKTQAWLYDALQTLELERVELEALRHSYWCTVQGTDISMECIPHVSLMRTGARVVMESTTPVSVTSSPLPSPGTGRKHMVWRSMQTLVALSLVHTISQAQALTEDTIAETLKLNLHRLRKAQNNFQHLVLLATGLLLLRQNATAKGLNGAELDRLLSVCKEELGTLLKDPQVTLSKIGFLIAKFTDNGGEGSESTTVMANGDLLSRVLNRSLTAEDTVFKRVSVALQTGIRAIMLLGEGAEGMGVVNVALQRIGVTCLQGLIVELGNTLQRVMSLTCSVHEPWYAHLLASGHAIQP